MAKTAVVDAADAGLKRLHNEDDELLGEQKKQKQEVDEEVNVEEKQEMEKEGERKILTLPAYAQFCVWFFMLSRICCYTNIDEGDGTDSPEEPRSEAIDLVEHVITTCDNKNPPSKMLKIEQVEKHAEEECRFLIRHFTRDSRSGPPCAWDDSEEDVEEYCIGEMSLFYYVLFCITCRLQDMPRTIKAKAGLLLEQMIPERGTCSRLCEFVGLEYAGYYNPEDSFLRDDYSSDPDLYSFVGIARMRDLANDSISMYAKLRSKEETEVNALAFNCLREILLPKKNEDPRYKFGFQSSLA
jgi:hypothetical protein